MIAPRRWGRVLRSVRAPLLWLVAGVGLGVGAVRAAQDTHFLALDGRDWVRFSASERMAWTQGFLAGQAVRGVADSLRADTTRFAAELQRQRKAGEFRFRYAPALYLNRVSDHYVWENHRVHPLWRAMIEVETVRQSP